ncbi:hypothetical protein DM01DRAFT_364099 [Hesseltinella vesiculosa]|uniref:Uncharacterized protein n=1 Tax=Hesseltinella vesiculosa TaxID=101127 RepID=A0A1X2G7G2_9FUNG|nr:hypothetical protein DM01DRAFT_364099 [Hesseltinella vesiculosa]
MALIKIISKFSKNGSSSIVTSSKNDSNNLTRPNNTSKKQHTLTQALPSFLTYTTKLCHTFLHLHP